MANEGLPRFPSGVEIVSAIAGRVRLRATDQRGSDALEAVAPRLREQEGVHEVRTNEQTGSVLIIFEPSTTKWSQLWEVLQQCGVSQGQEEAQEERSDLWSQAYTQIQLLIPSFVGIAVTRSLGIQGWSSIPAFMITAGTTRQVMEKFDLGLPGVPTGETPQDTSTENQAPAYSVISATPGRMRFHIREVAEDADYAKRVQRLAKADERITSVRLNRAIGSVVITYESQRFSDAEMRSHLGELIEVAGIPEEGREGEAGTRGHKKQRTSKSREQRGKKKQRSRGAEGSKQPHPSPPPLHPWAQEPPHSSLPTEEPSPPAPEETNEAEASQEELTQQPASEESGEAGESTNSNQFISWSDFQASTLLGMLNWMANSTPQKA